MIYIASSWRNRYFDKVCTTFLNEDIDFYNFKNPKHAFAWDDIDVSWKTWNEIQFIAALQTRKAQLGFNSDFDAMQTSDACVLVLPCGRSAHLEAGWFVGAKKPLHLFIPETMEAELMYKMATTISFSIPALLRNLKEYNYACLVKGDYNV